MSASKTWILIADSSRATLVEADPRLTEWRVLREFDHPEGRAKASEIMSDDRGRTAPRNRGSARRAAMAPTTPPHEVEVDKFSRELAETLRLGHGRSEFDSVILVAPPEFLGRLRSDIPDTVQASIRASVDKNLTKEGPETVIDMLREEGLR